MGTELISISEQLDEKTPRSFSRYSLRMYNYRAAEALIPKSFVLEEACRG